MRKAFRIAPIGARQTVYERLRLFRVQSENDRYFAPTGGGERVHCLAKMRIAADYGRHDRSDVELEQDAGDMILFTLQPGPHRKISQSEIWKVDENRIAELGQASDLALVGDCAFYFYSS